MGSPVLLFKRNLGLPIAGDVALPDVSPDPAWPHADGARQPDPLVESYRRLAEVFHHVLSEQSLDTLLDRIADTLDDLVPYDALQIYEADNTRRELIPVLARSEWENEIMRTRPAFGQGITGWAVVNREPVLANQAHLDPRVAFIPGTPAEPEALVTIPLVARGSLKGALNIYRLGETASFDEDEFELAKWFGDAAALALDNAQVRARLEHQAQTDSLTRPLQPPQLPRAPTRRADAREPRPRLGGAADVRHRRVQARQRHLRARGRRPDPRRARRAHELARPHERRRLPHRRRGVRSDHAVLQRGRRARARATADGAPRGASQSTPQERSRSPSASPMAPRTPATHAISSTAPSRR